MEEVREEVGVVEVREEEVRVMEEVMEEMRVLEEVRMLEVRVLWRR